MNRGEAEEYLRIKNELAQILTTEERQTFLLDELEPTNEARLAYIRDRAIPPLGAAALTGQTVSTTEDMGQAHEAPFEENETTQAVQWAHAVAEVFRENTKGLSGQQRIKRERSFAASLFEKALMIPRYYNIQNSF
jgi:hypothetical protein